MMTLKLKRLKFLQDNDTADDDCKVMTINSDDLLMNNELKTQWLQAIYTYPLMYWCCCEGGGLANICNWWYGWYGVFLRAWRRLGLKSGSTHHSEPLPIVWKCKVKSIDNSCNKTEYLHLKFRIIQNIPGFFLSYLDIYNFTSTFMLSIC